MRWAPIRWVKPIACRATNILKSEGAFILNTRYKRHVAPVPLSASSTQSVGSDSSQVDLLSRYRRKERAITNELDKFWKLPQEDMDSCDPIKWWYSRRLQFPNL